MGRVILKLERLIDGQRIGLFVSKNVLLSLRSLLSVSVFVWFAMMPIEAYAKNTIRPNVYPLVSKIQKTLSTFDESNVEEKNALLGQIKRLLESNPNTFEEALGHQFSGQLSLILENYTEAYQSFLKASELQVLDPLVQSDIEHTLAQLAVQNEQWQSGIHHFNQWFKRLKELKRKKQTSKSIKDQDYMMLAQAYFQLEQWKKAVAAIDNALAVHKRLNPTQVALESWYRFKLAALMNLEQQTPSSKVTRQMQQLLKFLVQHYPSMTYWRQLAGSYQQQGSDAKKQKAVDRYYALALSTLHAAHKAGFVSDEQDLLWMIRLMIHQENYHQAGRLLEETLQAGQVKQTIDSLTLLQDAWVMARAYEKAEETLQTLLHLEPRNEQFSARLKSIRSLQASNAQ